MTPAPQAVPVPQASPPRALVRRAPGSPGDPGGVDPPTGLGAGRAATWCGAFAGAASSRCRGSGSTGRRCAVGSSARYGISCPRPISCRATIPRQTQGGGSRYCPCASIQDASPRFRARPGRRRASPLPSARAPSPWCSPRWRRCCSEPAAESTAGRFRLRRHPRAADAADHLPPLHGHAGRGYGGARRAAGLSGNPARRGRPPRASGGERARLLAPGTPAGAWHLEPSP